MSNGNPVPMERADELKRALLALRDLRRQVAELEGRGHEPIAIVGMACRFPGGASTPERLWAALRDGVDATCDVPKERWDADAIYNPDPEAAGCSYVKSGGFLTEPVDRFDPAFFGISPREAASMDPIHRMLLEMAWEALESAGIPPFSLENSLTGVFTGLSTSDYDIVQRNGGLASIHSYRGTGTIQSVAGGRISHFLGLQGPNFPVDTACSSGLVALVEAVAHLRSGRCDLALAGSGHLLLDPSATVFLCRLHALSADGRCHTFDEAGAGYGRGEGGAMLVLKRLSDATKAGDPILAVVRGAACNHDGRSSGLTVPNPAAQQAVIEAALRDAGIAANQIDYVEAHGTATPLGDPIELRALSAVLCRDRPADQPLLLGSVKTNLGHLEPVAGLTGLFKVVQSLRHKQIPPHLHFLRPTPHVDWQNLPLRVPTVLTDWPVRGHPRVAGISAFGFSGTNAHVIVEEAPDRPEIAAPARPVKLIALSGRSRAAVRALAASYRERLADATGEADNLAAISTAGRSHLPYRACATGANAAELIASLTALAAAKDDAVSHARSAGPGPIAFLFTGQGAQYAGMGRELAESSPVFRAALERCAEILRPHLDRPLLPLLLDAGQEETLQQTAYTQPALFALEFALAELWRSWGVTPAYVLGHSLGEYVAATVAGVMDLEEALPLVALRGRLMQELPAGGRMTAVFAPEAQVLAALQGIDGVTIAAVNGPENVVISGAGPAVAAALRRLEPAQVRVTDLKVSHAFHSPLMDPILPRFEEAMGKIKLRAPRIGLVSNLTGKLLTAGEAVDPARWRRHLREPVRFGASMARLAELGVRCFVEAGPHPTLAGLGRETVTLKEARWLPTLRRNVPAWKQITDSIGGLYQAGCEIDWAGWCRGYAGRRGGGPTYPFQRERYWFTDLAGPASPAGSVATVSLAGAAARHPLLGAILQSPALAGWAFQVPLQAGAPAFLGDHRIRGRVVVPAAVFVEMIFAAAQEGPGWSAPRLAGLTIERPLLLADGAVAPVQILVGPDHDDRAEVRVVSSAIVEGKTRWFTHASGVLHRTGGAAEATEPTLEASRASAVQAVGVDELYQRLESRGIEYGPAFRALSECRTAATHAMGRAELKAGLTLLTDVDRIPPCLLDAGFQLLDTLSPPADGAAATFLPVGIDEVQLRRPLDSTCWIRGAVRPQPDPDQLLADLTFFNPDGLTAVVLRGFRARRLKDPQALLASGTDAGAEMTYQLDWQPISAPTAAIDPAGRWLVLADETGVGDALAAHLRQQGARCLCVHRGKAWAHAEDNLTVPAGDENIWPRLAAAAGGDKLRGIIHLWSLEARVSENATALNLTNRILDACMPLLHVLRGPDFGPPQTVQIVTRGAAGPDGAVPGAWDEGAALWGLFSVAQAEYPGTTFRAVDLDPDDNGTDPAGLLELLASDLDENRVALRGGQLYAPRLARTVDAVPADSSRAIPAGNAYRVDIERRGTLDALRYRPVERVAPQAGEVEVRVRATGLNFRDVLNVLGMYPGNPGPPGVEFAGQVLRVGAGVTHVRPGDAVMGIGTGTFASHVTGPAAAVIRVPAALSLEEAASIPLAFLTAEWGLAHLAKLRPGERVLIHAAAGGVGQAAVQLALAAGAEVFGTAGSDEKRDHLRAQGVRHVFDSRDPAFADGVRAATRGEGVDVVLNSLTGEMLQRSVDLLRPGGRFLELGKAELLDPAAVAARRPGAKYFVYDLGSVLLESPDTFQTLFNAVAARFAEGKLHPLRVRSYAAEDIVHAFRYMAQAKQIGKVVITAGTPPSDESNPAIRPDAAYLVTGASGGIGQGLVTWLVGRGAGAVILNARSAPNETTVAWMEKLRAGGARLTWVAADIADFTGAQRLMVETNGAGLPLRGVFHAAGVLDDGLLPDQTRDRIAGVLRPKVAGGWNLHLVTQACDLDHFVLFSSVAAVMGGPGQGGYAAANAFLGALAERRRRAGLPALAIDWGAWGGAGMAARLGSRERQLLEERGAGFLEPDLAFGALARLLSGRARRRIVAKFDWNAVRRNMRAVPPLLRTLLGTPGGPAGANPPARATTSFRVAELFGLGPEERESRLTAYVLRTLGSVLGIRPDQLEADMEIGRLGFDSLMAMELRNRLQSELELVIPVSALLSSPTPADLAKSVGTLLAGPGAASASTVAPTEAAGRETESHEF